MLNNNIVELLSSISLALFRKNFFGIYHGSISSKVDYNTFVINTKEAIFDEVINLEGGKRVILKISADKVLSEETLKNIKMASE